MNRLLRQTKMNRLLRQMKTIHLHPPSLSNVFHCLHGKSIENRDNLLTMRCIQGRRRRRRLVEIKRTTFSDYVALEGDGAL